MANRRNKKLTTQKPVATTTTKKQQTKNSAITATKKKATAAPAKAKAKAAASKALGKENTPPTKSRTMKAKPPPSRGRSTRNANSAVYDDEAVDQDAADAALILTSLKTTVVPKKRSAGEVEVAWRSAGEEIIYVAVFTHIPERKYHPYIIDTSKYPTLENK